MLSSFLKDHYQVLAFCSCPQIQGGTGSVFVYIKTSIYFRVLSSYRHRLLHKISEETGIIENFDSFLKKREIQLVEEWNQALESQKSIYQIEIRGDRIIFIDSRQTHPKTNFVDTEVPFLKT